MGSLDTKALVKMNEFENFQNECTANIKRQSDDLELRDLAKFFLNKSFAHKYPYNFSFLGRPIIQYPQDIVAIQELIWLVKPDLILETGIAHGGSVIMSAAMLALLDMCDAISENRYFHPSESRRKVLAIDVDIRAHNRRAIETHPLSSRICMIEGSSVAPGVIAKVKAYVNPYKRVLVFLDSNHTNNHVLAELEAYASLVSIDSYCVVFDSMIQDMPEDCFVDRPWGPGNNPKTAVQTFLSSHPEFQPDDSIEHKLLITVNPGGWLRRMY
jgi:cephalosporin hydroxylase